MRIEIGPWLIRSYREDDAEALARVANNRRIWRNMRDAFPHPYTLDDAHEWIARVQQDSPEQHFAIASPSQVIGGIGVELGEDVSRRSAEIGYWLGEPYWGQGIATVAARALTEYAFERFDLVRLEARVYEWNPASCRVLEKVGYTQEARLRQAVEKDDQIVDAFLYAMIRD